MSTASKPDIKSSVWCKYNIWILLKVGFRISSYISDESCEMLSVAFPDADGLENGSMCCLVSGDTEIVACCVVSS